MIVSGRGVKICIIVSGGGVYVCVWVIYEFDTDTSVMVDR